MANWSADTYYFGRLYNAQALEERLRAAEARDGCKYYREPLEHYCYNKERQDIIRSLQFKTELAKGEAFFVSRIGLFGPCVRLDGEGRWGTQLDLTEECFQQLLSGVMVHEGFDGYGTSSRYVVIGGEPVLHEELPSHPDDDTPEAFAAHEKLRFTDFVGRTPEEQHFFKELWRAVKQERMGRAILNVEAA